MGLGAAANIAIGGIGVNAVGSLLSGNKAASGADQAAGQSQAVAGQTRADLAPYNAAGTSAAAQLQGLNTSGFTAGQPNYLSQAAGALPGQMTQAQLEQTPGYQWNLTNGLNAVQNSASARGLGVSGAAMKGAATYATGAADSTYQNQFNNAQQNFSDIVGLNTAQQGNATNLYNRLAGTAGIGENAAAGTASNNTAAANSAGNYLNQAGQYGAAGMAGVGNAASGAAQNYLGSQALAQQLGSGGAGGYGNDQATKTIGDGTF